ERIIGGEEFARRAFSGREIGKRNNFKAANEIERRICDQAVFGEADRDREIRDDAIGIGFAGVAIEPCWKIDSENVSIFFLAQLVDVTTCLAHRLAQRRFRAYSE